MTDIKKAIITKTSATSVKVQTFGKTSTFGFDEITQVQAFTRQAVNSFKKKGYALECRGL